MKSTDALAGLAAPLSKITGGKRPKKAAAQQGSPAPQPAKKPLKKSP